MAKKIGFVGIKFRGLVNNNNNKEITPEVTKSKNINFRGLVNNNNNNKEITPEVTKSKNIFYTQKEKSLAIKFRDWLEIKRCGN